MNVSLYVIMAKGCGACGNYKRNVHDKLASWLAEKKIPIVTYTNEDMGRIKITREVFEKKIPLPITDLMGRGIPYFPSLFLSTPSEIISFYGYDKTISRDGTPGFIPSKPKDSATAQMMSLPSIQEWVQDSLANPGKVVPAPVPTPGAAPPRNTSTTSPTTAVKNASYFSLRKMKGAWVD